MFDPNELTRLITVAIPDAAVSIREFAGGGDHFEVVVTSAAFAGKLRVAQHQMVYAALHPHLDSGAIHALALTTKTPE